MSLTITQGFIAAFGCGLALNLLLILILFCVDCCKKSPLGKCYKLIAICSIIAGIGHCVLLYILTSTLDENDEIITHEIAAEFGGMYLTEFISRIGLYIMFLGGVYHIFNKTRFTLKARIIFIFILLNTTLLILLIMVIFDYQINTTFTDLNSDMRYINPILSFLDFVINLCFIIVFIRKLYVITYVAFYQIPNIDVNNRNESLLETTIAKSPTLQPIHLKSTTVNDQDIDTVISLSVLSEVDDDDDGVSTINSDQENSGTAPSTTSHYFSAASAVSTVIPFDRAEQTGNIIHINNRIKMIDVMTRTTLLSFIAGLFIQTVIIYRFIMNVSTKSGIYAQYDEALRVLRALSMFINGIVITLNLNVAKRFYKALCIKPHHCLEMCCVRLAKRHITKDIVKQYMLQNPSLNGNNYRQLND